MKDQIIHKILSDNTSGCYLMQSSDLTQNWSDLAEIFSKLLNTNQLLKHPDFLLIAPQNNHINLSQITSVKDFIFKTSLSGRKFLLIYNAELLNEHAAPALLKSLEDFSINTSIFLLVNTMEMLPATVLSRCIKLTLAIKPSESDLIDPAKDSIDYDLESDLVRLTINSNPSLSKSRYLEILKLIAPNTPFKLKISLLETLEEMKEEKSNQDFFEIFIDTCLLILNRILKSCFIIIDLYTLEQELLQAWKDLYPGEQIIGKLIEKFDKLQYLRNSNRLVALDKKAVVLSCINLLGAKV